MQVVEYGSDFSGVGAFDYAINRVHNKTRNVFACDMDKFARQSYLANHKDPEYYPENVYEREIPAKPLDIYMTSPPCQSFSLAGKRKGKDDDRGVLFFNSHEFIKENKPRFFIFENVKGLLSDDNGRTFQEWVNYLGGKSVNGQPCIFPHDEAVPYHIYYKVLNSKKHGVPQNRERIFIVGIRDDNDNVFSWPKEEYLEKRLKDVLESEVDDKYFLSDKMVEGLISKDGKSGFINQNTQESKVFSDDGTSPTIAAGTHGYANGYVSTEIIQLNNPKHSNDRVYMDNGLSPTLNTMQGGNRQPFVCIAVLTPDRPNKRQNGRRFKNDGEPSFTLSTQDKHGIYDGYKIRKLTPRECFRLQDFPDSFEFVCSDSQLYKQAGNSITVRVLELIIKKLKL